MFTTLFGAVFGICLALFLGGLLFLVWFFLWRWLNAKLVEEPSEVTAIAQPRPAKYDPNHSMRSVRGPFLLMAAVVLQAAGLGLNRTWVFDLGIVAMTLAFVEVAATKPWRKL